MKVYPQDQIGSMLLLQLADANLFVFAVAAIVAALPVGAAVYIAYRMHLRSVKAAEEAVLCTRVLMCGASDCVRSLPPRFPHG